MRRSFLKALLTGSLAISGILGLAAPTTRAQGTNRPAPGSYYYPAPAPASVRPSPGYYYPSPASARPSAGSYYYNSASTNASPTAGYYYSSPYQAPASRGSATTNFYYLNPSSSASPAPTPKRGRFNYLKAGTHTPPSSDDQGYAYKT